MSVTIQGLWIGPSLSAMERLSIRSFLAAGHDYHLYTYGEVAGVPAGATIRDAGEILPASAIFKYRDFDSYAGFANLFRYKLLYDRGGWWVDTDFVCLRPFDFARDVVLGSEDAEDGGAAVTNAVIRAPAGSPFVEFLWRRARARDPRELGWGETGPRLVAEAVARFALEPFVEPPAVFCPLPWNRWETLLEPPAPDLPENARAIHLWNEMWRRDGRDKDASYDPGSLYQRLRRRFPVAETDPHDARKSPDSSR